jgi:colanic acid/amylovoran biosynthesis glycosyltransferase
VSQRSCTILYVVTHHPRTTHTFVTAEIQGLRKSGHDVHVIALNEPTLDQLRDSEARAEAASTLYLKRSGLPRAVAALRRALQHSPRGVAQVALLALRSAGTDVRRAVWRAFHFAEALIVWDEAAQRNADTIHAQFGQTTSTIAWLAAELGTALHHGCTDWTFTVHGGSEVEDRSESVVARKAPSARAIIAVSDHTRSQLLRQLAPALWPKVVVARCGIDLNRFEMQAPRQIADPPVIMFVGRAVPAKGLPILLDAARQLDATGCKFRLVIVGAGAFSEDLAREAANGARWLELAGERLGDEVAELLRTADVFCLPSLDEGLPVSVMEAMATGVPVVTTSIAGIPELAVHGQSALVVPPANSAALADALRRALTDEPLRARLRADARRRVEEDHDERRCLPRLIEILTGGSPDVDDHHGQTRGPG